MIDDFLDYLKEIRRLRPNTVRLRRIYVRRLAADLDLLAATRRDLSRWILRREQEWTTETCNVAISSFRSFYKWAHAEGIIVTNPAAEIMPLRVVPTKPRIASPAQITAGLGSRHRLVPAYVLLGAECGLRVHEIAKLHTDDRDGEWLTIVGKGGVERTVHCSPELLAELEQLEHQLGRGYYFRSPKGGHLTAEAVRQRIREATGTNPHSLRHRAGTTVYRGTGNDLRVTQVFLGHANPSTTAKYVHVERDDLLAASAAARLAA